MIFDTDVLLDYLHGRESAAKIFESQPEPRISAITYMEMLQGKSQQRIKTFKRFVADVQLEVIPLREAIGERSIALMERYAPSHGLKVPDALIAATAMVEGESLCTGNARHFSMIPDLDLYGYRVR